MTVSNTADMIRAIDSLTVDQCALSCWCRNEYTALASQHSRYSWKPGDTVVRFPPEETL